MMKIFLQIIFILTIFFHAEIFSQELPNYHERPVQTETSVNPEQNVNPQNSIPAEIFNPELQQNYGAASDGSINPNEYFIGAGDVFFIAISGINERTFNLPVNPEGYLYLPKIGSLKLEGIPLNEAKSRIKNRLLEFFKDVEITISLLALKNVKVSVIGNVVKNSTFVVSGNSRLSDIMMKPGLLNSSANLRSINILNSLGRNFNFDLVRYLRFADRSQNPYLRNGDIIFIDKIEKTVSINGEVKYPAVYEFKENESVLDLINIAGSITNDADSNNIEIISFNSDNKTQRSRIVKFSDDLNQIFLKNKDKVIVRKKPEYLIERYVKIDGFVNYPGTYKIVKNKTTLTDIIVEAGGFREDASLKDAYLVRNFTEAPDRELERLKNVLPSEMNEEEYAYSKAMLREVKGRINIDFEKLFYQNNENENLVLRENDYIFIPEKKNFITLVGQVKNPGSIGFNSNLSVDDYIELAGGFSWRAKTGDIRVIRSNTNEWVDADDVNSLEPGDTIWVLEKAPPNKFWTVFKESLAIVGQIASVVAATIAIVVTTR